MAMSDTSRCAVHPRERGEQGFRVQLPQPFVGSSPRARGTVKIYHFTHCTHRFIPASAGNSELSPLAASPLPVHPRERGEQTSAFMMAGTPYGSSPRARGTDLIGVMACYPGRFIPASAGNRCWPFSLANIPTVHPRERGEQVLSAAVPWAGGGSSPRARGTGPGFFHELGPLRFIPASAGNSSLIWGTLDHPAVHPRERGEQLQP